jgi:hypothetical protein
VRVADSQGFFPSRITDAAWLSTGALEPQWVWHWNAATPPEGTASWSPAGYHSPVCSNPGDPIDRIAAAIDQLASDARAKAGEAVMAARVALLWQMMTELDPELARRTRRYTAADDGTPVE